MHLVIIGGSDAGISAALRARELDSAIDTTVLVADEYPNYSICGIPFHVSGEVIDWHSLAHRTRTDLEATGMKLLTGTTVRKIEPKPQSVWVSDPSGNLRSLSYDRLVIGTGATPILPPIGGLRDLGPSDGVHILHTLGEMFALERTLSDRNPSTALIVGAGYIGMEMADALATRGLQVTVAEQLRQVLATLDPELAETVRHELEDHGVEVVTDTQIRSIERHGNELLVRGSSEFERRFGVVLIVVGVKPETSLATDAGITTGSRGAIAVNRRMETNLTHIYAAGDCAETYHRILRLNSYLPLGTTAHKQGRVAGENAIGGDQEFAGSLGTQVVKVFGLHAARTGLRDREAEEAGFTPLSVSVTADDHKAYYPGAAPIAMRWTGDIKTGKLLGAQLIGHTGSEVAKRIDVAATALFHGMLVDDISDLDLSYTPPLGSPWDALQVGAQVWVRESELHRLLQPSPSSG
jgi:NADPH-dependent 2,4-dienoyl-CoA reductase/sulfur reductase-like enzyme